VANVLVGGATFGVVYLVADAARLPEAALGLEALRFAIVGALVVLAVRAGVHGLRETAGGRLARRGRAIAGIVVASFFGLLVTLSLVATAVLALALGYHREVAVERPRIERAGTSGARRRATRRRRGSHLWLLT